MHLRLALAPVELDADAAQLRVAFGTATCLTTFLDRGKSDQLLLWHCSFLQAISRD